MKKRHIILHIIFCFFYFSLDAQQMEKNEEFYYYQGEKNHIQIDYTRVSVVSADVFLLDRAKSTMLKNQFEVVNTTKSSVLQNINQIEDAVRIKQHKNDVYLTELESPSKLESKAYFELIRNIQNEANIIKVSPTYTIQDARLGLSNNFYVKLFNVTDESILSDLADKYNIHVLGYNKYMPLWYTLSCTKETPMNALEAANLFFETQLFESSEPEFLYHNLQMSDDQYFSIQWGLKNTGQYSGTVGLDIKAEQAWTITTGRNIKVAVFDQGIEMSHPDLERNIFGSGYDATTGTTPSRIRGSHGTACAGIIGAQQDNEIGISGVAPNCQLISISMDFTTSNTPQQIANGLNWAWDDGGADVISNSWGGYAPSGFIEDAIINAQTQGRDGKGTVIVFASGNDNTSVLYPARLPNVIAVGAIDRCGIRAGRKDVISNSCDPWCSRCKPGSCYGDNLDLVAPGTKIFTTDRQGDDGYISGNYYWDFGGTSAACPHVAGVAALVLSVNPNLNHQEVRDIIESTAQEVGGYNYGTKAGRTNGTWNEYMGYGLVDAYAAVQACIAIFHNQTITASDITITACNDLDIQNVTVQNGGVLTLEAPGVITINEPFEVTSSSYLNVRAAVMKGGKVIYIGKGGTIGVDDPEDDTESTPEGTWLLHKIADELVYEDLLGMTPPSPRWYSLTIEGNQLYGKSSCNTFLGNLANTNSTHVFANLVTTYKACLSPLIQGVEKQYVSRVQDANYMHVSGDNMYLFIGTDPVLEFYRQPE